MSRPRLASSLGCSLACAAAFASGCGPGQDGEQALAEAVATLGEPIQGGYVDELDTAAVGIVMLDGWGYSSCTGSLIASNVVLTAQHCVAPVLNAAQGIDCAVTTFGAPSSPDSMYVTPSTVMPTTPPAGYFSVAEVVVPPNPPAFCGRDVAILILPQPLQPSEAVPLVARVDSPLAAGEIYSAVGFGRTSDSQTAPSGTRHRRDNLLVSCVGDACPHSGSVASTEWQGETGICQGDSGGPALDAFARVTGVTSRGSAGCDTPVYGHVQGWGEWIKQVTIYAQGLVGAAPPPWTTGWPTDPAYSQPVGSVCTLPEQCPSKICNGGTCTRLCNDLSPCPAGYLCDPQIGLCLAAPPPPQPATDRTEESGCSVAQPTVHDPTQPNPWAVAAGLLGISLAARRRCRRR
jgi:hypothetical protein